MKRKIMLFMALSQIPGIVQAKVFCTQEIVQKMWVMPLPYVKSFYFGTAEGQGESKAEARFHLAQSRKSNMTACEEDVKHSQIGIWCADEDENCESSLENED